MIKDERGVGLIEVLVALAILGIVAAAFLSGLATASKAIFIADERTTAESLARSQMEHIKNQSYSNINEDWNYTVSHSVRNSADPPDWYSDVDPGGNPPYLSPNYAGYSVEAIADEDDANAGIQKITVTVIHNSNNDKEVMTLEDYKVER